MKTFFICLCRCTATGHYFGSRAELCLHIAAYGHYERVVHSMLLLKFIEHCNHPCFPLCAVLEESLLVSNAVMCRRIYCSPFLYILGRTIFFKCFSSLFLSCAFALAVIHAVPCKLVAPGIALLAMSWLPL